jgi:hypothetical protein
VNKQLSEWTNERMNERVVIEWWWLIDRASKQMIKWVKGLTLPLPQRESNVWFSPSLSSPSLSCPADDEEEEGEEEEAFASRALDDEEDEDEGGGGSPSSALRSAPDDEEEDDSHSEEP